MLRLRTTSTLSLLALGIGVAGTQWISGMSGGSAAPAAAQVAHGVALHRAAPLRVAHRMHGHAMHAIADGRPRYTSVPAVVQASHAAPHTEAVTWVPVSMPVSSIPFTEMRAHDEGNLVLHLVVDGRGQVAQAWLAQSSGDAVLDAHALAMAHQWRFAVPADHPDGFSGDLPLSFGTASAQFAQNL
jgi:periplasmic protein TonB